METSTELQRQGTNLKRIWEDTDFQAVFAKIQADTLSDWVQAKTKEKREELHADYRALTKLQEKFHTLLDRGTHADRLDTRPRTQKVALQER